MPQLLKFLRYFLIGRAQLIWGLQLLTALVVFLGCRFLWIQVKPKIVEKSEYQINDADIRVWNPPVWVPDRFVQEVLDLRAPEARAKPLNSLDPELIDSLLVAFGSHPWVKKVERIELGFPGRLDVRLVFKTPIAVVDPAPAVESSFVSENGGEVESGVLADDAAISLPTRVYEKYVVDANGYRLPDEYFRNNPNAYYDFFWILGIRSTPVSGFGQCVDPLVVEAAAFAEFLERNDVRKKWGVDRIVVEKKPGETRGFYFLKTTNNIVVKWGYFFPEKTTQKDKNDANDSDVAFREEETRKKQNLMKLQEQKIARLEEVAKKFGSLDNVPFDEAAELDVSSLSETLKSSESAAFDNVSKKNGDQ